MIVKQGYDVDVYDMNGLAVKIHVSSYDLASPGGLVLRKSDGRTTISAWNTISFVEITPRYVEVVDA